MFYLYFIDKAIKYLNLLNAFSLTMSVQIAIEFKK